MQSDIVLIDFLQTDLMQKNLRTLSPSTLWALAFCSLHAEAEVYLRTVIGMIAFVEIQPYHLGQQVPDAKRG